MAELSKLGRYELRRILGRGAMGVVYEGFDPTLGRRVAVKTILKGATLDEETERAYSARFVKEAKAVGRLNHPNIVQVHDFGEENEIAYLVMEFIQGRELRSFFAARERFEPAECVRIMGELLDALDFAHEAGVVHRDVKPANVMLDAQRRVKLADFGVARVLDGAEQSMAGTMVGTPAFMSPEQISGGKVDRRTDVFSAGTILYQLLTGEQPFTGDGAWTVARKIMQDDPARPSSIVTNLPLAFDEVVSRALAKTPAQRFATAREFAGALRGTLPGTQPAAASPGTVMPKQKTAPAAQASETEIEFWRALQNSNDAEEFSAYLDAFPEGTYAQLARLKMAKLKASPAQDAQATVRLAAEDKARLEAEEQAKRKQAEEQARQEAEAKRVALEKAKREAEANAEREALAKAKREAEERGRRVAEEKARRDAEEKAKREAAEKVKRETAEKAKREAEDKIRQAQALTRLKQQEEAAARAKAVADEDATVSIGSARPATPPPSLPAEQKKSYVLPAVAAVAVVAVVGIGAFLFLGRTPAPAPVAQAPVLVPAVPPRAEISAADIDKIRKETEDRIRREYADKSAAEQAAAAKAAGDKAVQEKQLAMKAAAEKAATEKAAADKLAAEKAAAEKTLTAKAAAEKVAAEKAAAEKIAAEKAAAERAAAEKAAAEKAAAEKAVVAAKPGWPAQGDRWVYEAREANNPDKKYQVGVEIVSVSSNGIHDSFRAPSGSASNWHYAAANLIGEAPGVNSFVPYLRAFQEVNGNVKWNKFPIRVRGCAPQGGWTCIADARVVGRERVSVRAGSFETWKIVVEMGMRGSSGGTYSAEFTYWYAEEAKRYVKYQSRIHNTFFAAPSMDMELLSYTPAGSK